MTEPVIASFIITPDGTVLQSFYTHDYKTYTDTVDGEEYMIDGGCSYLRCSQNALDKVFRVTINDTHKVRRKWFHWGSYGKGGNEELHWIALQDMEYDHIMNVLNTQYLQSHLIELFIDEIKYRKQVSTPHTV